MTFIGLYVIAVILVGSSYVIVNINTVLRLVLLCSGLVLCIFICIMGLRHTQNSADDYASKCDAKGGFIVISPHSKNYNHYLCMDKKSVINVE